MDEPIDLDALVGTDDVAPMLGVSPNMVRKLARQGVLPCYRIGHAVRYKRRDVLAYLERCRQPGGHPAGSLSA